MREDQAVRGGSAPSQAAPPSAPTRDTTPLRPRGVVLIQPDRLRSMAPNSLAAGHGAGLLSSLRPCPAYAGLPDHGTALEAALTDGVARHRAGTCRGHGFRPILVGLVNRSGTLRFRSGDHALTIDGTSPNLTTARIAQKPAIRGFFASVRCGG